MYNCNNIINILFPLSTSRIARKFENDGGENDLEKELQESSALI